VRAKLWNWNWQCVWQQASLIIVMFELCYTLHTVVNSRWRQSAATTDVLV